MDINVTVLARSVLAFAVLTTFSHIAVDKKAQLLLTNCEMLVLVSRGFGMKLSCTHLMTNHLLSAPQRCSPRGRHLATA